MCTQAYRPVKPEDTNWPCDFVTVRIEHVLGHALMSGPSGDITRLSLQEAVMLWVAQFGPMKKLIMASTVALIKLGVTELESNPATADDGKQLARYDLFSLVCSVAALVDIKWLQKSVRDGKHLMDAAGAAVALFRTGDNVDARLEDDGSLELFKLLQACGEQYGGSDRTVL